jgi:hypothetical protein
MSKLTIIKAFWRHCINGAVAAFIAIACFLFESSRVLLEETDISLEELEAEAENPMGGARALGGVCLLILSSPEEGGFKSNRSMENDDLDIYGERERTWDDSSWYRERPAYGDDEDFRIFSCSVW